MAQGTDSNGQRRAATKILQMLIAVAAMAIVTGVVLWPTYRPSPDAANQSVKALQSSALMALVRSVHHWSSALMIVLGGAYVVTALATASYRSRRMWIGGLALMGLTLLFQLTGHLLPWDQQAVRTASIETGIAEGAPGIGPMQANLLRGGDTVGPATLSLWFRVHALILPAFLLAVLVFVISALRRRALSLDKRGVLAALAVLVGISFALAPPLGQAATSADYGSFAARPEWYVLPLHSLLNIFEGINPSLGFVGSMVIPTFVALLLIALPWQARDHGQPGRPVAVVLALVTLALFVMNFKEMAPPIGTQIAASDSGQVANRVTLNPALVANGKTMFTGQGCDGCHKVNGVGGKTGPDLTKESERHPDIGWQIMHLQNPAKMNPGSTMPNFKFLDSGSLKALANYLVSKK